MVQLNDSSCNLRMSATFEIYKIMFTIYYLTYVIFITT